MVQPKEILFGTTERYRCTVYTVYYTVGLVIYITRLSEGTDRFHISNEKDEFRGDVMVAHWELIRLLGLNFVYGHRYLKIPLYMYKKISIVKCFGYRI